MNYIGSKYSLLDLLDTAYHYCNIDNSSPAIFCDIFAGTGRVGRHFKSKPNTSIIANDMEYYSYALINHYIKNNTSITIRPWLDKLNSLKGIDSGFIFNHYAPSGKFSQVIKKDKDGSLYTINRQYFSDENARIIDESRMLIDKWLQQGYIENSQYDYLLASILEASDKVANTASVYGSFLKKIKKTAQKKILFSELPYEITHNTHYTYNENANELIKKIQGTVLYLDPPYNHRQYGSNYHILNTIAKYDNPSIKGVTGMREYNTSSWCKKNQAREVFEQMIADAKFSHILFSYNSESIMSPEEIADTMTQYGKYSFLTQEYARFKADSDSENRNYKANKVIEYVHILKKD